MTETYRNLLQAAAEGEPINSKTLELIHYVDAHVCEPCLLGSLQVNQAIRQIFANAIVRIFYNSFEVVANAPYVRTMAGIIAT
jgi:hypothetical protein